MKNTYERAKKEWDVLKQALENRQKREERKAKIEVLLVRYGSLLFSGLLLFFYLIGFKLFLTLSCIFIYLYTAIVVFGLLYVVFCSKETAKLAMEDTAKTMPSDYIFYISTAIFLGIVVYIGWFTTFFIIQGVVVGQIIWREKIKRYSRSVAQG